MCSKVEGVARHEVQMCHMLLEQQMELYLADCLAVLVGNVSKLLVTMLQVQEGILRDVPKLTASQPEPHKN